MSKAALAQKIRTGQYVPDILDCLAQLSNDEVPTPPTLARAMLEALPDEVWSEPDYKWLDPFCKSGVFLREVAARLLVGLEEAIPDFDERREHIYREMLFGASITEMTGQISRRSLYCSRDASGEHSIVRFENPEGNLPFVRADHTFPKKADGTVTGGCEMCGAPLELERGDGRENYAYAFIHGEYPTKEMADMKFDVIVGNPPYQIDDGGGGGGASAIPVYNLFVERALDMEPRHVLMITPSRWFSGGKGLDSFRDRMLNENHFVKLVDYPRLYDCFPGVKIRGGVSYWHWQRDYWGPCEVATMFGDEMVGNPVTRSLGAYDVFVRRNEAVTILDKVSRYEVNGGSEPSLGDQVSPRRPFRLSDESGYARADGLERPVLLYANQRTAFVERSAVHANEQWVDKWKVLLVKAHGTSGKEDLTILGEPVVAAPGSVCTETYLVIGVFSDEAEAQRLANYMRTRFVRFLVSLRKITQNITRDSYRFVPALPMDRDWSDEQLFARYGLTGEEIAYINSVIVERPTARAVGGNAS